MAEMILKFRKRGEIVIPFDDMWMHHSWTMGRQNADEVVMPSGYADCEAVQKLVQARTGIRPGDIERSKEMDMEMLLLKEEVLKGFTGRYV